MSRTNPESVIQSAICEYLIAKGWFVTRINNIPAPIKLPGRPLQFRKLPKYTAAGFPDVLAIKGGRSVFFEVKQPKGKLSPAQNECHAAMRAAEAEVYVVYSIDDVQSAGF